MPKKVKSSRNKLPSAFRLVKKTKDAYEYELTRNGLRVLYIPISGTGVVTTNITYRVGARDELAGETGIAHMFEHMLFKPTTTDVSHGFADSASMRFERETGCILNANTWKDRTTYYFSYPKEHFKRALTIEAERMVGGILNQAELTPERNNVLSEFDMYNGDPYFALAVQMVCSAFHSHPYGHETIGFREDIERYTPEMLETFYRLYYRPDNAVLIVAGDIERTDALQTISRIFGKIAQPNSSIPRHNRVEPIQEGIRRVSVERPSKTNLVSIGVKHAAFPSHDWFVTQMLCTVLTEGEDSILHKALVDTHKATAVSNQIEPTSEVNLGALTVTLAPGQQHNEIETIVLDIVRQLNTKDVSVLLKKNVQKILTAEAINRTSSLQTALELTEYVSAERWEVFYETEQILRSITPREIVALAKKLFTEKNMTVGYFKGNV